MIKKKLFFGCVLEVVVGLAIIMIFHSRENSLRRSCDCNNQKKSKGKKKSEALYNEDSFAESSDKDNTSTTKYESNDCKEKLKFITPIYKIRTKSIRRIV